MKSSSIPRPSASLRRSPSGPLENGHAVGLAKPGYTGAPGSSVLQKVDPSLDATFKIQALTLSDEDSRADRGTGVSAPDEAFSPGSSEKVLRDANSPRHSDTGGSCSPEVSIFMCDMLLRTHIHLPACGDCCLAVYALPVADPEGSNHGTEFEA